MAPPPRRRPRLLSRGARAPAVARRRRLAARDPGDGDPGRAPAGRSRQVAARARREVHLPDDVAVEVIETNRGGKSTFHGPGQLVCYPILDLNRHGKDLKRYVRDLERAIIATVAPFGLPAVTIEGLTGVWLDAPPRKLASIGIHVSRWVTTHGFALNVDLDPAPFTSWITACGLEDAQFTTMSRELGRSVSVDEVKPAAIMAMGEVFGLEFEALPAADVGASPRGATRASSSPPARCRTTGGAWPQPGAGTASSAPSTRRSRPGAQPTQRCDIMRVIIMAMTRTTIVADDALLDRLRAIAAAEQKSLGAVIREGLELRAQRDRPPLTLHRSLRERGARARHRPLERGRTVCPASAGGTMITDTGVVYAAMDQRTTRVTRRASSCSSEQEIRWSSPRPCSSSSTGSATRGACPCSMRRSRRSRAARSRSSTSRRPTTPAFASSAGSIETSGSVGRRLRPTATRRTRPVATMR